MKIENMKMEMGALPYFSKLNGEASISTKYLTTV